MWRASYSSPQQLSILAMNRCTVLFCNVFMHLHVCIGFMYSIMKMKWIRLRVPRIPARCTPLPVSARAALQPWSGSDRHVTVRRQRTETLTSWQMKWSEVYAATRQFHESMISEDGKTIVKKRLTLHCSCAVCMHDVTVVVIFITLIASIAESTVVKTFICFKKIFLMKTCSLCFSFYLYNICMQNNYSYIKY